MIEIIHEKIHYFAPDGSGKPGLKKAIFSRNKRANSRKLLL
jgi:hypothetical protein